MFWTKLAACAAVSVTLVAGVQVPALADGPAGPTTLVVGVDHVDAANQSLDQHRWFEYTDFFARDITVHRGEVLDFRFAAGNFGHAIALAPNRDVAREVYPFAILDREDPFPAIATGKPKFVLGPSNFVITGGSTNGGGKIGNDPSGADRPCGVAPLSVCTFKGGDDIEAAGPIFGTDQVGNPITVDWQISVDAPPGDYAFLCFFHPGMQGHFSVVNNDAPATSQAANAARSNAQFVRDRALAAAAEAEENVPHFSGGLPGTRMYDVAVGVAAADDKAAVLAMLPQHVDLVAGDRVSYTWKEATNEPHTVSFPTGSPNLPGVAVVDCGANFQVPGPGAPCLESGSQTPEYIFDPGTAAAGSPLISPMTLFDSGVLLGTGYHLHPTAQKWSLSTNTATMPGSYAYQCQIHDVMHGSLTVRSP